MDESNVVYESAAGDDIEIEVNGEKLYDQSYSRTPEGIGATLGRPSDIELLTSQSFQELAESMTRVEFPLKPGWSSEEIKVEIGFHPRSLRQFDWSPGVIEGQMVITF